jgi:hypothetical protein
MQPEEGWGGERHAPGQQAEREVGAHSVAGAVARHEVQPARGLGNKVQRRHEHDGVALHAAAQDAHLHPGGRLFRFHGAR